MGGGGGELLGASITITYNAPPQAVAINDRLGWIVENSSTATRIKVGDIAVADDDEGANGLTLTGADAAFFEIIGDELFLKAGVVLDFETKDGYSVAVQVDDPTLGAGPDSTSTAFTLRLIDLKGEPHDGTATSDTLIGTAQPDEFVFDTALNKNTNIDVLIGFDVLNDEIHLDNSIFRKLKTEGALKAKFFNIGKQADDGNDYLNYNKRTGALTYDRNGDDDGGALKFAVLLGSPNEVKAADFLVI